MIAVNLDGLDLAALLTSRVCHDVINPVGAIVNGLEVLDDDKDGEMHDFALDLIKKSAKQASARLQFARIAFGAAGSAGSSVDTGDAEAVARGYIQDEKNTLIWIGQRAYIGKNKVKLLLNLLAIATTAIPRGGILTAEIKGSSEAPEFLVTAKGSHARIPPHSENLLAGHNETGTVDSHTIQLYFAGLMAKAADMHVAISMEADTVSFLAKGN